MRTILRSVAPSRPSILPRATLTDVVAGRAPLIGSRVQSSAPRGFVSPVEARVNLGIPYDDLAIEESSLLERRSLRRDAATMLRALVTAVLRPSSNTPRQERPFIVSAAVDNLLIRSATDNIVALGDGTRAKFVHFVHPHALNLAANDRALARHFADADVVLADGVGIRLAARVLGVSLRHNVNGTDLLPLLCRRAVAEGIPLVLVGGADGVAEDCARTLLASHPGLRIELSSHGFLDDAASGALADRIDALGRCIVLVGMGSPVQERWAWRHLARCRSATVVTVGGLFDFFSHRVERAPLAWREVGLEWLWRARQEPRRLAKRYFIGNPAFVLRAAKQRVLGASRATP